MKKYIIHEAGKEAYHAGSKATRDCEEILLREDFRRIDICNYQEESGFWIKVKKRLQLIQLIRIKRKSIVVVQHPMYIGTTYMRALKIIHCLKRVKSIFVIHDLESLRKMFQDYKDLYEKLDNMMFQIGDVFIVHNARMKDYLIRDRLVDEKKLVVLGLFDYLADKTDEERNGEIERERREIAIAGNLSPEKCGYLYLLCKKDMSLNFNLYGLNYDAANVQSRSLNYKGAFPPEKLPSVLKGDYGLVWDGNEMISCAGNIGNYLRYNNPHKVSLYIAAEIPVIIWKQAALAEYITGNKIGIAIESLEDLETAIYAVSPDEYAQMKKNIKVIAERVRKGDFFAKAYQTAEQKVKIK